MDKIFQRPVSSLMPSSWCHLLDLY